MKNFRKALSLICCTAIIGTAIPLPKAYAVSDSIVINEVCAKNTLYASSDGKFYDWIELYNKSDSTVDLSGYGLSDTADQPYKFTFPDGTKINPKGRIMVFCNSKDFSLDNQLTAIFGISTDGETITLTDKSGNTADEITFGLIDTDVSYGRVPDGSDNFSYMTATPDAENSEQSIISKEVSVPEFSKKSGFYDNEFSLSISSADGTEIYYTTDGSNPDKSSQKYTSPITVKDISSSANTISAITDIAPSSWMSSVNPPSSPVDKAFIIKAVAIDNEGNISKAVTNTYFIGYKDKASYYQDKKIFSIVTDKNNLFDYEKGIYVLGKVYDDWKSGPDFSYNTPEWETPANYTQKGAEWEREISLQMFENGNIVIDQNAGLRIHGGATRSLPQKSFNLYARNEYGSSKFDYDLFSGSVLNEYDRSTINSFDSFILRNGGNDAQYTRFRDKLNQQLVANKSFLSQGAEPCIVFINGEFWGQYEITEKLSDDYIKAHCNIGKKSICIVKNQQLDTGDELTYSEYLDMWSWINSTDFSDDANYQELCSKIDMQEFMEYMSAELYFGNNDWGSNNVAMWKSTKIDETNPFADGKWRFILFDTEYSANLYNQVKPSDDTFSTLLKQEYSFLTDLLTAAMQNKNFNKQFVLTFMDMANDNFKAEKISEIISELSAEYEDMANDTYKRFWSSGAYMYNYSREVQSVQSFYNERFSGITTALKRNFSLKGNLAQITVQNDSSCGNVKINTITPEMTNGEWSGKYYTDYPVTLTAEPNSSHTFVCWKTSDGKTLTDQSIQIQLAADMTITAVYEEGDIAKGDINADGNINALDILSLKKYLLNMSELTSEQLTIADINSSGDVNIYDLIELKRIVLN